jgi:glycosyltransferase involved in cell wall biosynthesis
MKPSKLRVISVISDSNIGGAGNVLVNFLKRADFDSFEHIVIVPTGAMLTPRIEALGVRVVEMPGIGERSFAPSQVSGFLRQFRQLKPDIVHTHASFSARIAARLYHKCAIVHTRHSVFPITPIYKRFFARKILGAVNTYLSDRVIAISPAARENLIDMGVARRKIIVMMNGVEPVAVISDEEKRAARVRFGSRPTEFICAIIARLEEVKGHIFVLEAARILRDKPIKFIIAGTGTMEEYLRAVSRDMPNCVMAGFVSDINVLENIMDLQLNASYGTEASSMSLTEGMSLGIPAVVSDFGGNPSLITDGLNGIVVPQKDGAAMAAAILRLYSDKREYDTMSRLAHETFSESFTAEIMARNIEAVYYEAYGVRYRKYRVSKQSDKTERN